ncbi:Plexin-B [Dirofilaria immitis]
MLQILINRKDGKSLMNDNNTDEILKMNRFIANNAAINMNDRFSSSLAFTFPKARIFEKYIFMGYSIVDLHYSEHDATIVDSFKLFILHFMMVQESRRILNLNCEHCLHWLLMNVRI